MPTELVLLSEVAPTPDGMVAVAARVFPDGQHAFCRDGAVSFANGLDQAILTVHPSKPVHEHAAAAAALKDPPEAFALWAEMTVPYGHERPGRHLAEQIAAALGGTVRERA